MKIDFDKKSMVDLKEAVEYYKEHEAEIKANIKEAIRMSKEITTFCEGELNGGN